MTEQQRDLTVVLEPLTGTINGFYVILNGKRIIPDEAQVDTKGGMLWKGKIPEGEIRIKIRTTGIDAAQYKVKIDLPGNMHDQEIVFTLDGGYHEWEMRI
jgi:hypothetical protein